MDTPETKGGNEPYTFMSKFIGRKTSSSKELLKSIKVDKGKCKDDTKISSLFSASYFTMKAMGTTFTANVMIHGGEDYALKTLYHVVTNNLILPCLDIPMDPMKI
jgi:hypothetical protein